MTLEEPIEATEPSPESPSIIWRKILLERAKALSRKANERLSYLYRCYPPHEQDDSQN